MACLTPRGVSGLKSDDDRLKLALFSAADHALEIWPGVFGAGQGAVDVLADDFIIVFLRPGVAVVELALDGLLRLAVAGIAGVYDGISHSLTFRTGL